VVDKGNKCSLVLSDNARDDNKTRTHLEPIKSPHLKIKWVAKMGFKQVWSGYGKNG